MSPRFKMNRGRKTGMFRARWVLAFFAFTTWADELDLTKWQELSDIASQQKTAIANPYLPANMKSVSSRDDFFQQVVNYQVRQASAASPNGSPIKIVDTKWQGGPSKDGGSDRKFSSYEVRPLETRGFVEFKNGARVSASYQVWTRETEFQLSPGKVHGMSVVISHVDSPIDQKNRIMMGIDW